MTVAALPASVTYAENGVTTSFAVPFRFKAAGDLIVSRIAAGVETVLALGTDYTVTGGDTDAGGTLTRLVATNGASLKITRSTARVQPMQYTNGGVFPAKSHEEALDRQMLIGQEQDDQLTDVSSRALMLPPGESAPDLPPASQRLGGGKILAPNPDTGAIEVQPIDTAYQGPPGEADNSYSSLVAFRASDVTRKVASLVGVPGIPDARYYFERGAGPYVENLPHVIKADSTRLDEGAWVRQKGNAIGYQWAGTPTDVDSALRNLPTLLDAFAKTTQTQIIAGTWTGDLSTAIRAAVQGKDHFVIPPGIFPFKGDMVEITTPGLVVHGMGGVLKKMGGTGSDGVGILVSTHAQLINMHIDATVPNPTLGSNFNDLVQVNFTPATPSSRVLIQNLKAKGSSSNVLVHRGGLLEVDGLFAWNTYANGLQLVASNMFGRRIRIYTTVTQNGIFATSSGGSLDTGDVISNVHLEDVYIENSADTGIELGYGCHDCTATNFITVNCVNPGALGRDNQRCTFRNGRIYAPAYSDQISSYNAVAMVPYFRGASYETGSSFEDIEVIGPCKVAAFYLGQSAVRVTGLKANAFAPGTAPTTDGSNLLGAGLMLAGDVSKVYARGVVDGYSTGFTATFDGAPHTCSGLDVDIKATRVDTAVSLYNIDARETTIRLAPGSSYRTLAIKLAEASLIPSSSVQNRRVTFENHARPDAITFTSPPGGDFDTNGGQLLFPGGRFVPAPVAVDDFSPVLTQAYAIGIYTVMNITTNKTATFVVDGGSGLSLKLKGDASFGDDSSATGIRLVFVSGALGFQQKDTGATSGIWLKITGSGVA